jgi:hypothetical protein
MKTATVGLEAGSISKGRTVSKMAFFFFFLNGPPKVPRCRRSYRMVRPLDGPLANSPEMKDVQLNPQLKMFLLLHVLFRQKTALCQAVAVHCTAWLRSNKRGERERERERGELLLVYNANRPMRNGLLHKWQSAIICATFDQTFYSTEIYKVRLSSNLTRSIHDTKTIKLPTFSKLFPFM